MRLQCSKWIEMFDLIFFRFSFPPLFLFFCLFWGFLRPSPLTLSLSPSLSVLCVSVSCVLLFCFHFRSVLLVSTFLEILESFKISIDPRIWDLGSDLVSPLTGVNSTIHHLTDSSHKKIKSCGDIFNVSMPLAADWRLLCA
jgi:hypothetical protein